MNADGAARIEQLVAEHGRLVFAAAFRILGQADDAEDVLQEVFYKVLRRINWKFKWSEPRDWGAYLRVMAVRQAIDHSRKKRVRKELDLMLVEAFIPATNPNPRQAADSREQAELLRGALQTLPKKELQVFVLKYLENLSYEQIALHTGFSINFIGVLLFRARKRLQTILQPVLAESRNSNAPALTGGKEQRHVESQSK